jgi:hypothetical protein
MKATVQLLLQSFDHLADSEKRELATEVLRRTIHFDLPALTDDELVQLAEERFLDLENEEKAS